jgi:putative endonuclease
VGVRVPPSAPLDSACAHPQASLVAGRIKWCVPSERRCQASRGAHHPPIIYCLELAEDAPSSSRFGSSRLARGRSDPGRTSRVVRPERTPMPGESRGASLSDLIDCNPTTMHRRRVAGVYILECSDDSLYVGSTTNLTLRLQQHQNGDGGSGTQTRRPVRIIYTEEHPTIAHALSRERQLKRWSAQKKRAVISGDLDQLKSLAKRRRPKKVRRVSPGSIPQSVSLTCRPESLHGNRSIRGTLLRGVTSLRDWNRCPRTRRH